MGDGVAVSDAGDVNGDGIADLIIGGAQEDPLGTNEGESYVVFGTASGLPSTIDLSALATGDGSTGFAISGSTVIGQSGFSVSVSVSVSGVGDVDNDGIDHVIIGANTANGSTGQAFIIYGSNTGFSGSISLGALGGAGFAISGIDFGGQLGVRSRVWAM